MSMGKDEDAQTGECPERPGLDGKGEQGQTEGGGDEETELEEAMAGEEDALEELRAVEPPERQQVESVDREQRDHDVLLQRVGRAQVPDEEDDADGDAGDGAEEQDDCLLPRGGSFAPA